MWTESGLRLLGRGPLATGSFFLVPVFVSWFSEEGEYHVAPRGRSMMSYWWVTAILLHFIIWMLFEFRTLLFVDRCFLSNDKVASDNLSASWSGKVLFILFYYCKFLWHLPVWNHFSVILFYPRPTCSVLQVLLHVYTVLILSLWANIHE